MMKNSDEIDYKQAFCDLLAEHNRLLATPEGSAEAWRQDFLACCERKNELEARLNALQRVNLALMKEREGWVEELRRAQDKIYFLETQRHDAA